MTERIYGPQERIVAQGAKNDRLFFINHGGVSVTCRKGGKEIFIRQLGGGEMVGENFFRASLWTVSLTAQQQTGISVLNREGLARLEHKSPGIESKLMDYYFRHCDISAVIRKKGVDRREYDRHRLERKIQLQIIDERNRILSGFRGLMTDISQGGLSFWIRITRKETCRLLLGRRIRATVPVSGASLAVLQGTITGIQVADPIQSDYSIHVRLDAEMEQQLFKSLLQ